MVKIKVKSHVRNGHKVNSYTRNSSSSGRVGNCSVNGVLRKAKDVYSKSNVKNPIKTGNGVIDLAVGQIPFVKKWNLGFNLGKFSAITKITYDETCKKKK